MQLNGVTKTSIKFNISRKTIYRWIKAYDGTIESLRDKSRRAKHHPNEHTEEEIKMIKNFKRNNKETGLVVLWIKLQKAGYTRTVQGLYYAMKRIGIYNKIPSKAKRTQAPSVPKATYPGERVQVDVKYVPLECLSKELRELGERFYHNNIFMTLEDLRKKGKRWRIEYNNFPMRPLGWLSPNQKLAEYLM